MTSNNMNISHSVRSSILSNSKQPIDISRASENYTGRPTKGNKINAISGNRPEGFNKVEALKNSIKEIRFTYSEEAGESTFEQILGLADSKHIPDSMKSLSLNKYGTWSNQAITLGVKKELAALFIAEEKERAFSENSSRRESTCNLDFARLRAWFHNKFNSLKDEKTTEIKYNDDLIKNIWQHVSHENDCFGKFNGFNDITLDRNTNYVSFGEKGYNYQEKMSNLILPENENTRAALRATKAAFDNKGSFELKTTSRFSIIPDLEKEAINGGENIIVYIKYNDANEFIEVKSKADLPRQPKYIKYCAAGNTIDISMLKTLGKADLLVQKTHTEKSITAYFLDEANVPPTLKIRCLSKFSPVGISNNQSMISISAHKTIDLITKKILNYAVNVSSGDEALVAPYKFWVSKLEQEWNKNFVLKQDDKADQAARKIQALYKGYMARKPEDKFSVFPAIRNTVLEKTLVQRFSKYDLLNYHWI